MFLKTLKMLKKFHIKGFLKINIFFMKYLSFISYILESIDIFRFPLQLTFNKKEKSSTYSGRLFSLCILVFIIFSIIESDMIQKTNPTTLSQKMVKSYSSKKIKTILL